MLFHSLVTKGQRIFHILKPAQMYADCDTLPAGHFAAPQCYGLADHLLPVLPVAGFVNPSIHH